MSPTGRRPCDSPFYVHGGSDGKFVRVLPGPGGGIEKRHTPVFDAPASRFDYSAAELATAAAIGAEATRKCMETVREMSAWRDRTLEAALAAILAAGVPRESLILEYVTGSDEVRVKQRTHPALPIVIGEMTPGVVLARIWTEFNLDACTITQHYEGPALSPVCVEHAYPNLPIDRSTKRKLYADLDAAVEGVSHDSHESPADVRSGLASADGFRFGGHTWKIVIGGALRPEDIE